MQIGSGVEEQYLHWHVEKGPAPVTQHIEVEPAMLSDRIRAEACEGLPENDWSL